MITTRIDEKSIPEPEVDIDDATKRDRSVKLSTNANDLRLGLQDTKQEIQSQFKMSKITLKKEFNVNYAFEKGLQINDVNNTNEISLKFKRVRTGVKPCTCCQVYQKKLTERESLKRHKRVHTGEKPYTRAVSQKIFTQTSNLKTHQKVHTSKKPYTCTLCQKKFKTSQNLVRHLYLRRHMRT